MADMSRRRVLAAGLAGGAAGALGMGLPAWGRATHPWTWGSADSVAGFGSGLDPDQVWDDVPDRIIGDLLERGEVPRINQLLWDWERNDQPLPSGLPTELRDFMESARQLPSWVNRDKLEAAKDFNKRYGLWLNILNSVGSGILATVIPNEARSVYYSAGGADMEDRVAKTSLQGFSIATQNAWDPDGTAITQQVKTRLVHSAVRSLLPQSPKWGSAKPITQEDFLVTWHSLATFAMKKFTEWEIRITRDERDAYLHQWLVTGYMLGFDEQFLPMTWEAAYRQYDLIMDRNMGQTPEGVKLCDTLLFQLSEQTSLNTHITRPFVNALTRHVVGDKFADWAGVQREPHFDPLVAVAWKPFVRLRQGLLPLPLVPEMSMLIDDALKAYVQFYLTKGEETRITIPTFNNPNYPDNSDY